MCFAFLDAVRFPQIFKSQNNEKNSVIYNCYKEESLLQPFNIAQNGLIEDTHTVSKRACQKYQGEPQQAWLGVLCCWNDTEMDSQTPL